MAYDQLVSSGANSLVQAGWTNAQEYASDAFARSSQFLNQLQSIAGQLTALPDIGVNVGSPEHTVDAMTLPDAITRPTDLTSNFPMAPAEPILADVAALSLPTAPEFGAALPDIDLAITAPTPLAADLPADPTLTDVAIPDLPTLTLPDVPTMAALNLPGTPSLEWAEFTDTLDDLAAAPTGELSFIEPAYSSTLLDGLKAFLAEWVAGAATGLDPAVEQALWDRARAREDLAAREAEDAIRVAMSGRGFPCPPGAMALAVAAAVDGASARKITLSRDISIKQAELEQSNRHFAVTTGTQLEGQLLTYANAVAQRAFELSRATLDAGIQIFQAQVQGYAAKVQAFGVRAQVWRERITAELAKLEVYKAELEGQRLIGQINIQATEVYRAQLQGVLANVDLYRAQVEAASVRASVNKSLIEAFVARIQGYGELVRAKAAEYEGYATRVKAEVAKVDIFRAQAEAYKSTVDGYQALTNARVAEKTAEIRVGQELPLEVFKSRIGAFTSQVQAEAARLQALANVYETDGRVYGSQVQAEATKVSTQADVYRSDIQRVLGEANVSIQAAQANLSKMTQALGILAETVRAGAQVSAQLAASALSSVNLSGSVSDSSNQSQIFSDSETESNSTSNSTSVSENHFFDETKDS